ncbi:hypothetical protein GJ496_005590, partial [Pomphorhynchus laevis]
KTQNVATNTFDRLPHDIIPDAYHVEIHLFFDNFTFHSKTNISFKIDQPTKYIILNALYLDNLTASIVGPISESNLPISQPRYDVIRITPFVDLVVGDYVLSLECDGYVSDDLLGLYRSKYAVSDTVYPYLFTTKFESSSARRVFPCWDEPQFKSKFTIVLIGPYSQNYYCNMPMQSKIVNPNDNNEVIVTFQETPLMSTYLIAFVIGELSIIEQEDAFHTLHRVIVPKGSVNNGSFALKVGIDSINMLSIYFRYFFVLPKLDMLAVRDFQSGAMEHWGLVTYRESRLLPDENSPLESQIGVITTICHENAHMWFGDLVTMRWWNDLWLNEGFASWVEILCTDSLHPEYDMWSRFLYDDVRSAMLLDWMKTTHPVVVNVDNTDNIRVIYNAISYRKGSSILRMLNNYVTPPIFQKALQNYISKYAYQNTITSQLWDEVTLVSESDINAFIYPWISRPGFPFVQVVTVEHFENGINITLTQKRLFADGTSTDEFGTIWNIPIDINCASSPLNSKWSLLMNSVTQTFELPKAQNETWLKLNFQKYGFFVTMYTDEMLNNLIPPAKNKILNNLDRFDIVNDLYMLASAGHVKMSRYMDFARIFDNDTDYTLWMGIGNNIQNLGMLIEYMSDSVTIHAYGEILFKTLYDLIGIDEQPGEAPIVKSLRALALRNAGLYGYLVAENWAFTMFKNALTNTNFRADLREPVFIINANKRGGVAYAQLKQFYLNAASADEQRMALVAMGYTLDTTSMEDIMNMICYTGEISLQDIFYPFRIMGIHKAARDFAWMYTKANIKQIISVIPIQHLTGDFIQPLFSGFATESIIPEMESLFTANNISLSHGEIEQTFDQIRVNSATVQRSRDDVLEYLKRPM